MPEFLVVGASEVPALSSFLSECTTVLTTSLGWVAEVASTIRSDPMLLVPAIMGIGLVCIGIYKALRH